MMILFHYFCWPSKMGFWNGHSVFHALFCLCMFTRGEIFQRHGVGSSPKIEFDLSLSGGMTECTTFVATGNLTVIGMDVNINLGNEFVGFLGVAKDIIVVIKTYDLNWRFVQCTQFGGYDYKDNDCLTISDWADSSWESSNAGLYSSTIFFRGKSLLGGSEAESKVWSICVGNGWHGSTDRATYRGQIDFNKTSMTIQNRLASSSPTLSPSVAPTSFLSATVKPTQAPSVSAHPTMSPQFKFTSESCNAPLALTFDVSLSGYQQSCTSIGASGDLTSADVSLSFLRNSYGLETASDMGLTIYHTGTGRGVQLGGYSYAGVGVGVDRVAWPRAWRSLESSSSNSAALSLSSYGVGGSAGYYQVCLVNGYKYAGTVHYGGSVQLNGLAVDCTVASPIPTHAPSQYPTSSSRIWIQETVLLGKSINVSFNAVTRAGDIDCINVDATGDWTRVFISLNFGGDNLTWASDLLVSVSDTITGECFHIGGSTVDMSLRPACEFVLYWPISMNRPEDAHYVVDEEMAYGISSASGFTTYEICVGNGYSKSERALFQGSISFSGLSYALPPTPAPSHQYDVSISTDRSNTLALFPILIICFVASLCIIIIITVYCRRRTAHMYKIFENDLDDINDVTFRFDGDNARHTSTDVSEDNGNTLISRTSIQNLIRKSSRIEMNTSRVVPKTLSPPLPEPSKPMSKAADIISHNAKKLFNRPKSLETIGHIKQPVPSGAGAARNESRLGWFDSDAFGDDSPEESEYSLHVRLPYGSPKGRKTKENDESFVAARQSNGETSEGQHLIRTISDELNDQFVETLLSEVQSAEVQNMLRIDLNDIENTPQGQDSEVIGSHSESADSTESKSEAINFVSVVLADSISESQASSFGNGATS